MLLATRDASCRVAAAVRGWQEMWSTTPSRGCEALWDLRSNTSSAAFARLMAADDSCSAYLSAIYGGGERMEGGGKGGSRVSVTEGGGGS